jgi:hypothetical protein
VRGDVYFNRGQYDPSSMRGRELLAHEITHVLQQEGRGAGRPLLQRQPEPEAPKEASGPLARTYAPWTRVWLGYPGLVGEVVEGGVTVRLFEDYDDLPLTKRPGFQAYECGPHDLPPIPELVAKMRNVARKTAATNAKIPGGAEQRVTRVAIIGDSSENAYRGALGQGLIVLARTEFDTGSYPDSIAHEGSHAIFEYRSVRGSKDPAARVPDALALRVADLFGRLSAPRRCRSRTASSIPRRPPSSTWGRLRLVRPD